MTSKKEILDYYNTVYADFVSGGGSTPSQFSQYLEDLGPEFFTNLLPPTSAAQEEDE